MASYKEVKKHLEIALKEIGEIKPWFDRDLNEWIFSHSSYPVEYGGDTPQEVVRKYPIYLREFIRERLNKNLSPLTEKKTKGRGGKRKGAGRPKGSFRRRKKRISVPADIAEYLQNPESLPAVRELIAKNR